MFTTKQSLYRCTYSNLYSYILRLFVFLFFQRTIVYYSVPIFTNIAIAFELVCHVFVFILRPCQHDDGYIDRRPQIKNHTDERTQVHSARSSMTVNHPSTNRGRRCLTSVNMPPSYIDVVANVSLILPRCTHYPIMPHRSHVLLVTLLCHAYLTVRILFPIFVFC